MRSAERSSGEPGRDTAGEPSSDPSLSRVGESLEPETEVMEARPIECRFDLRPRGLSSGELEPEGAAVAEELRLTRPAATARWRNDSSDGYDAGEVEGRFPNMTIGWS